MNKFSPGFRRRSPQQATDGRLPPGQHLTEGFPVLSAGPTPRIVQAAWRFTVETEQGERRAWSWQQFMELPQDTPTVDVHCVTHWSKYDTTWQGVSLDTLLEGVETRATHAVFHCYGGYTTNVPLPEITGGRAWIAHTYDGRPLAPEHGGPARALIPHLYFWKSAKWVQGLRLLTHDQPGFWETAGYHNHGDPWREERYSWN
ncbi:sulfite oxidase-like oxidoreductase [Spirillospora sp. CA-253888]